MLKILSFLSGWALGLWNYRMFVRAVSAVVSGAEQHKLKRRIITASILRHLFVFLAGISLIRGAHFAPFHLCGGILLATYFCRYREWRSQQLRKEIVNS